MPYKNLGVKKKYNIKYYLDNKEKMLKRVKQQSIKTYRENKKWFVDSFGNKCAICGKTFPWYAYDFHHRNNEGKDFKMSKYMKYTRKYLETSAKFKDELSKCILVCAICHRKLHLNGGDGM